MFNFDAGKLAKDAIQGLEKAEKLGGTCRFSGETDEGFEADIALPLQKEVKDD